MFVVIHHSISDPKKFWSNPEKFLASIPAGLRLHSSYPNADGTRATCLWECTSGPKLREFVDEYSDGISLNEYVQVDEAKALGLPNKTLLEREETARA